MAEMDYRTTLQGVRRWPLPLRVNFVQEVLATISLELPSISQDIVSWKEETYEQARGAISTDGVYYTDEMVEQTIREAKAEKYGLEDLV